MLSVRNRGGRTMGKAQEEKGRPEFAGTPLLQVPMPTVDLLRGDEFGMAVLSEFHDRVRKDFDNNSSLRVLKTVGEAVEGSNPFAVCLLDMILRPRQRVATPPDLQAAFDAEATAPNPPNLRGCYKDCGLVLRSIGEPNSYLAQRLNEQVGLKTPLPVVILLSGLELVKDPQSPFGLAFKLTENSIYFTCPVMLQKSGHFDSSAVDEATGLPTTLGGADRFFYAMRDGLARLYIGRGWSVDSIWDELANSQPDGGVVIADNAVPPPRVAAYLSLLRAATSTLGD
jgi:hypothetical protein